MQTGMLGRAIEIQLQSRSSPEWHSPRIIDVCLSPFTTCSDLPRRQKARSLRTAAQREYKFSILRPVEDMQEQARFVVRQAFSVQRPHSSVAKGLAVVA